MTSAKDRLIIHPSEPVITKDELNLCEFPFALLTDRAPKNVKTLFFSDRVKRPDGKTLDRRWTITGSDAYGLPTAADEPVYLALMEQARRQGFESRKIEFTVYELVKRLGMPDKGDSYNRIRASLLRLNSVTITADSAFYDFEQKDYRKTYSFHILEAFSLEGGSKSKNKSYVRVSEELWKSIEAGSIKSLDFTAYLSLNSAVSRRLYRYLDKVSFDQKKGFSIGLKKLCFEHLGMSRNYYPSQLKRLLDVAHSELIELDFLTKADYREGKEDEVVTYRFGHGRGKNSDLAHELNTRGVTLAVARRIARTYSVEVIKEHIKACDEQKPKNPGAWLRTAIQTGYAHKIVQDAHRGGSRVIALEIQAKPPEGPTEAEIDALKQRFDSQTVSNLESRITDEVLAMTLYRDRGLTTGARMMIEARLIEELSKMVQLL